MITQQLTQALAKRILVLDGAMGTMIQQYQLAEEDYRGERFAHWQCDVKGNNDLLVLTRARSLLKFIMLILKPVQISWKQTPLMQPLLPWLIIRWKGYVQN